MTVNERNCLELELDAISVLSECGYLRVLTGTPTEKILRQIPSQQIFEYLSNAIIQERKQRFSNTPSFLQDQLAEFIELTK